MTAICPASGASQPKTTTPPVSWLASVALGAILRKFGLDKAAALAGFLDPITLVTSTFCAVDPPTLPTITDQDVFDLIGLNPFAKAAAGLKFDALIAHYAWFELCECVASPQPAPTSPPAWPTGAPTSVTVGVPIDACDGCGASGLTFAAGTNRNVNVCGQHPGSPPGTTVIVPLPAGATSLRVRAARTAAGATHAFVSYNVQFWTQANGGSQISVTGNTINTTGTQTAEWVFAVPPNALGITATLQGGVNSQTDTADMFVDVFCGGQAPGGEVSPCCPPDENLQSLLTQILTQVNLLQRHVIPFATVDGSSHGPLTGEGSLAVQGLVGVRVSLSVTGSLVGQRDNNPDVLLAAGFVAIESAGGMLERRSLDAELIEWLPRRMSDATSVSYFLTGGVTASITELEREP